MATSKLSSPQDWIQWFSMVKTVAMDQDVWIYCDPDRSDEITQPEDPDQLTATQERLYTLRINDYERKRKGLAKVNTAIQSSVSEDYQTYLQDAYTPRQRLTSLRTAIKPSTRQIEDSVREEYDSLIRGPKRSTTDRWLNRWIALAPRLRALSIPNLGEAQACRGFIQATETLNPAFYNSTMSYLGTADAKADQIDQLKTALVLLRDNLRPHDENGGSADTLQASPAWHSTLDDQLKSMKDERDPNKLTLVHLVGQFKAMQPSKAAAKQARASYATFQNHKHDRSDGDNDNTDQSETSDKRQPTRSNKKTKQSDKSATEKKPQAASAKFRCVCGGKHRYPKCYYLAPHLAPATWRYSDVVRARIIAAIQGNQQLKTSVQSAMDKANIKLPEWYTSNASKDKEGTILATGRAAFVVQRQAMATTDNAPREIDRFRLDSCSDTHVCNDRHRFSTFQPTQSEKLKVGDTFTSIQGTGSITIAVNGPDGLQLIDLNDVAYCPAFHVNLVSYLKLKAKGVRWNDEIGWLTINSKRFIEVVEQDGWPIIELSRAARQRSIQPNEDHLSMATSKQQPSSTASIDRWHTRLGHPSLEVLKQLPRHVQGVQINAQRSKLATEELCAECTEGQQRQHIQRAPIYPGSYPFEKVHLDLIAVEKAFNLDCWVLHFYCVFSGFHVVYTLPAKNGLEVARATETFIKLIQAWGYTIRQIQSDVEASLGMQWIELLRLNGITHRKTAPYTHDQNGAAERSGGVIITTARKIYLESKLPISLWPYFIDHAVRIINRLPIQRKQWVTPYELVHGRQPNLAGFKVLGSKVYVLNKKERDRPKLQKLRSKSIIGYLLGVLSANIFIVWIPQLTRAIYARDVEIDELQRCPAGNTLTPDSTSLLELTTDSNEVDLSDNEIDQAISSEYSQSAIDAEAQQLDQPQGLPTPVNELDDPQAGTPIELPVELPIELPIEPPRLPSPATTVGTQIQRQSRPTAINALQNLRTSSGRTITQSAKAQQATRGAQAIERSSIKRDCRGTGHSYAIKRLKLDSGIRQAFAAATAHSIRLHQSQLSPPPNNWGQMLKHPEAQGFQAAAQAEIDQLRENDTWTEVQAPQDHQVLPLRWVFTYKTDPEGYLVRYKARLCVRGDLQWPTYDDIYAATGAYRSLRILLAIVAVFDLICEKGDVKNAFTKAHLDQPIYTHTAPGFSKQGIAYQLKKALYGLKISPKLWYIELSSKLKTLGFQPCPDEPCLFINPVTEILIFIYVDDLLFIAHPSRRASLNRLQRDLDNKYGIQGLGPATSFLNIRLLRDTTAKSIWLLQDAYIDKIAHKYGQARLVNTPLSASFQAEAYTGEATSEQTMAFQQRIGSIIHSAVVTRPDIAFAASALAQFSQNPSPQHLAEANHVIAYLYSTKHFALQYSHVENKDLLDKCSDQAVFKAASDASYADDVSTRRSSQGYLLSLFQGPVAWQASKQKTVTTSTTEAELLSLSHTTREVISMIRLFSQIGLDIGHKPSIQCDNQQTISLINSERPQMTTKLKHVDIQHHWVRQARLEGTVEVHWVPTSLMPADGLTKRLSRGKQASFLKALSMINVANKLNPSMLKNNNCLASSSSSSGIDSDSDR